MLLRKLAFSVNECILIYHGVYGMDNMDIAGERDGKPQYDPSMNIIGWLAAGMVVWSLVLLPWFMLS